MPVKILVADDSATMRKVLELTFAGEDAQVISVDSVAAAFAEAQKSTPDVIFADLSMPGDDGYALARMIKSTPALSRAAVVVLSSTHTPYDATKGGAAGVDDNLDKPFDSKVAIEKVASVLVKPRASASAMPASAMPASAMPAAAAAAAPAAAPASTGPVLSASSRPSKRTVAFGTPAIPQAGARPAPPKPPVQRPTPAKPPEAPPAAAPHAAPPAAPRPAPVLELAPDEDLAPSRAAQAAPKPAQAAPKPAQAPAAPAPQPQAAPAPAPAAKVAAATSAASPMAAKLGGLGLDATQIEAILALSREVVEQVVWEVVPEIAEAIIREEIRRLTAE